MVGLYESLLSDFDTLSAETEKELCIGTFVDWYFKYIARGNHQVKREELMRMIDIESPDYTKKINIPFTLSIPRKTTLIPKLVNIGDVLLYQVMDPRYFDKHLNPEHADVWCMSHIDNTFKVNNIEVNATCVLASIHFKHKYVFNIEDSRLQKNLGRIICFNNIADFNNVKINSDKPVTIILEPSWVNHNDDYLKLNSFLNDTRNNNDLVVDKRKEYEALVRKCYHIDDLEKMWGCKIDKILFKRYYMNEMKFQSFVLRRLDIKEMIDDEDILFVNKKGKWESI